MMGEMVRGSNWVRNEIIQALRQGYSASSEDACIQRQADALMHLIGRIVDDVDTFHSLIGYLNDLRLVERESEDAGEKEDADG